MDRSRYPNVLRALAETPWAILPGTLEAIVDLVQLRADGGTLSPEQVQARIGSGPSSRPGMRVGAVAVLPLYGVLFPRATMFSEISGGTSMQQWARQFDEAVRDPDVDAVLIDVHSPGGSTALVAETADRVYAARGRKRIVAVANTMCASAAYHVASQAHELVATPSAVVGSIGVFTVHQDITGLEEKLGVKSTLIAAGTYKTEGNPLQPLTEEARAALDDFVREPYELFTAAVARARNTTADAVEHGYGEGRVLPARAALRAQLVDRVDTFDATLDRLRSGKPAGATGRVGASVAAADAGETGGEEEVGEALASIRAVASDIREQTELGAAVRALRSLTTLMRPKETEIR